MKQALFLFLVVFMLYGCASGRRCTHLQTNNSKDSIFSSKEVVFKDTTVYLTIPSDTVVKTVYLPIKMPKIEPVTAESETAFAKAWIYDDRLSLILINKFRQIPFTFQSKETNAIRTRIKTEVKTIPAPYVPKVYKWCLWIVIIQIVVLLCRLAFKYLRLQGGRN